MSKLAPDVAKRGLSLQVHHEAVPAACHKDVEAQLAHLGGLSDTLGP